MDLREAGLQLNHKVDFGNREEVEELYNYELGADKLFLTLGKKGSVYFDGADFQLQPAFKGEVKDTIGAGDTFYAFSCIAAEVGIKPVMAVPALAASLSCTWLCNEESVTKDKLLHYADRFV